MEYLSVFRPHNSCWFAVDDISAFSYQLATSIKYNNNPFNQSFQQQESGHYFVFSLTHCSVRMAWIILISNERLTGIRAKSQHLKPNTSACAEVEDILLSKHFNWYYQLIKANQMEYSDRPFGQGLVESSLRWSISTSPDD